MPKKRILVNGKIYTVDKANPWAEAIVIEGNKIAYVGSNDEAKKFADERASIEDLGGRLVTPGLIDGHIHAVSAIVLACVIMLSPTQSLDEMKATIKGYIDAHPELPAYMGMGWADNYFGAAGPNKKDLDEICPNKPIAILSASGHCGWVNSKALEAAHIDKNAPDPNPSAGHVYVRDAEGSPTGYFKESSCTNQIFSAAKYIAEESLGIEAVNLGQRCASTGITSVVDCGNYDFCEYLMNDALMMELEHKDNPVRVDACGLIGNKNNIDYALSESKRLKAHYNTEKFRCTFLKILNDGTLENFSAAIPSPYPDAPLVQPSMNVDELVHWGEEAAKAGLDLNVHAIGSVTVHYVLEAARILREKGYDSLRIICSHSSYVFADDIDKFAKYNVVANSTGKWFSALPAELNDYVNSLTKARPYPMGSIKKAGGRLSLSSDYPTDALTFYPMPNMEVAITRQEIGNKDSFVREKEDRMTIEDVIEAYTINNAYIMRMEDVLGSLEVGKLADLVVFEDNLFEIDPYSIHDAKVHETIMDGVTRYKAK
jgi:predicted amidohydrolase YtcJ